MFKTWLCANLGIVYVFLAMIILGIAAIFLPISLQNDEASLWFIALIGICMVSAVLLFACEPRIGPIISVFALAGLYILFIIGLKHPEDGGEIPEKFIRVTNTIVIVFSAICAIPAFLVARYANINFEDVVSRRWMYRNSGKDVFESTWKYTFNRFFMTFLVAFCLLVDIAIVVVLVIAERGDGLSSIIN